MKKLFINIAPYILFSIFGISPLLMEYLGNRKIGKDLSWLLWSYYLFPFLILIGNYWLSSNKGIIKRILISIGSGGLFLILGALLMLLFAKLRIELGLVL
jgi:hypothetical protein